MWPNDTFTSRFRSIYVNDDAVQVIRQTGAHSDSDVMVLFRKADVIVTGDIVDLRHFPVIDPAKGGSIQGELDALNRLLTEFVVPNVPQVLKPGRTLVVPGHGYVSDYGEVVEYRDMVTVISDIVQELVEKGMTLAAGEGGQSDEGVSRPLRQRHGTVDDGHVRRGGLQRPEEGHVMRRVCALCFGARASLLVLAVGTAHRHAEGRPRRRVATRGGAHRSHRPVGRGHLRRLALADDHARRKATSSASR